MVALLSPVVLFVVLLSLLYIPAVQNWVVQRVASYASSETGMEISVDRVRLRFPLDLQVDGVLVIEQGDTIADIGQAVADIRLLPLLKGQVVINGLLLGDAKLNTKSFIDDMRLKGTIGELSFSSPGINLAKMDVRLAHPRLQDSNLTVFMSDTAAIDTSTIGWHIAFDRFELERSRISIVIDSAAVFADSATRISAFMGQASLKEGDIHLGLGRYGIGALDWQEGELLYGNDICLSGLTLGIDSIFSYKDSMNVAIRQGSAARIITPATPHGGLQLASLQGRLSMNGERLMLYDFAARTPQSALQAQIDMAFADMATVPPNKAEDAAQNRIELTAEVGKEDLMLLAPQLPKTAWPDRQLTMRATASGTLSSLDINQLSVMLPTAFQLKGSGHIANIGDMERLMAQVKLEADAYGQLTPLLHRLGLPSSYRVPAGTHLAGNMSANGNKYTTSLALHAGRGTATLKASANVPTGNMAAMSYDADIAMRNIDLRQYMPGGDIGTITANVKMKGQGVDPFDRKTKIDAQVKLHNIAYDRWQLDSIDANINLSDGMAMLSASSANQLVNGSILLEAQLSGNSNKNTFAAKVNTDLALVDLYALGFTDSPMAVGLRGSLDIGSDMNLTHSLAGDITSIYIRDSVTTRRLDDVYLRLATSRDTTMARMVTGDFSASINAKGDYEQLFATMGQMADTLSSQLKSHTIDQPRLKQMLPTAHVTIQSKSGKANPIADMLYNSMGIGFDYMDVDLYASPLTGLNGKAVLLALTSGDTRLDTIALNLEDRGEKLSFNGRVTNSKKNPMGAFRLLYDGQLREYGAMIGLRYFDEKGLLNVRLGAKAEMATIPSNGDGEETSGIRFQLVPSRPTLGYKEFTLNDDNYLLLHDNNRIEANIDLKADDGTQILIYTENNNDSWGLEEQPLQDITVSVSKLDLGSLTSNIALLPKVTGVLNGDYHLIMDQQHNISVASDMSVKKLTYEGSEIGNIGAEFVYLWKEDDTHVVDATLLLDDEEIGTLKGSYTSEKTLKGTMELTRLPLSIANAFMGEQLFGFEGTASGTLSVAGPVGKLQANGTINFADGYFVSKPYGVRMKFGQQPITITNSVLQLNKFELYSYGKNPLTINGNIDLYGEDKQSIRLVVRAKDFQLINAKQTRESVAYGKAFVNIIAILSGNMQQLSLRGRLDVLGTTDLNYILLDSPLSTDSQMDELVQFVDFSDSTSIVRENPETDFLNVDMNISIDHGAHLRCALNTEQTNYVNLQGGGDLRLLMDANGMSLLGRYTVEHGTMKYSLPIIPLKTFTIKEGSYVEFTGQPDNPTLNITATEENRASVSSDGEQNRNVTFECGVEITRTLSNMGLEFTISAPEDMQIQNELNAMSTEQRGKLAVTMLTTGMYLSDGNTNAFSMNSALSSFLQNEINNITAGALKTVDLQLGFDNSTDASGQTRTDYSFKFAKRFWNNRLNVQIGGKVSTGSEMQGQQQSFFDNVSMEYRLSPTSNQYLKLFYNQNVYDWLEGYTGEYGGGYIWKRKLDSLFDLFRKPQQPIINSRRREDSPEGVTPVRDIPQDSVKANEKQ